MDQELIERFPKSGELQLLDVLRHEIRNFEPNFSIKKIKQTLILSNYASQSFGFDIINRQPCIGVPRQIFNAIIKVRWFLAGAIKDKAGIYLIMEFGRKPNSKPVALRINMRTSRVNSLLKAKSVKLIAIDEAGQFENIDNKNSFDLPIEHIDGLFWETEQGSN